MLLIRSKPASRPVNRKKINASRNALEMHLRKHLHKFHQYFHYYIFILFQSILYIFIIENNPYDDWPYDKEKCIFIFCFKKKFKGPVT